MNPDDDLDSVYRCMHGVSDCGGAPAWNKGIQWLKPQGDDSTHEECGAFHAWRYQSPDHAGRLWVCCKCSDMLREYGTLPFTFLIEELPI